MRSIYFTPEHDAMRAQLARFVEREVKPSGEGWEAAGAVPRDVLRKMGELGFLGLRYPERFGGLGLDTVSSVMLAEELGRSTFSGFAITVLVHTDMASPHLARFGTEAQLERYMPGIIKGDLVTAVAVTEPDAGSDVAALRTHAVRQGEEWRIDGAKMFITNGALADVYFVAARTDPGAKGSRGISIFIVEKGTSGFKVARKLDKMGWRSSDTAELVFEDCRVPAASLLGQEHAGFYQIMRNFQNERLVLGAMAVGEAETALRLTLDYVKTRRAFGGTLWDKQAIRQRLSALSARIEAARQLVYHAAWLDAQEIDCVRETSMVKALCGELVNETLYDCLQFHGGAGYMTGMAIERMARDARIQAIGGGATEVMLEEVAKRLATWPESGN